MAVGKNISPFLLQSLATNIIIFISLLVVSAAFLQDFGIVGLLLLLRGLSLKLILEAGSKRGKVRREIFFF